MEEIELISLTKSFVKIKEDKMIDTKAANKFFLKCKSKDNIGLSVEGRKGQENMHKQ